MVAKKSSCAVILPLTSKGHDNISEVQDGLQTFYDSCILNAGDNVDFKIFLGIDIGDPLLDTDDKPAEVFLKSLDKCAVIFTEKFKREDPANICGIWTVLSRLAYETHKCDYYILLGDDVKIKCPNWFDEVNSEFQSLSCYIPKLPFGFGCVALVDIVAPGFPTFPIIHKTHMEIFSGQIIPNAFINQDGDPFLFNLYRPFNAARFAKNVLLENLKGGVELLNQAYVQPRYVRVHICWKKMLHSHIETIRRWTKSKCTDGNPAPEKMLIDVVIPSYRALRELLEGILKIEVPSDCVTKFIIVIDNPSAEVDWLMSRQMEEVGNLTVLRNAKNVGASITRNNGIKASSADWIVFIDDDVKPAADILKEYAAAIKISGADYDGFAGPTVLPIDHRHISTAILLSGVSFFWTYPSEALTTPWAVTANVGVRNYAKTNDEHHLFDTDFIKTGGGEDIDYCLNLKKRTLKCVPNAVAHHPWWNNCRRDYNHFFRWAVGDCLLIKKHPQHSFLTPPNVVEVATLLLVASPYLVRSHGVHVSSLLSLSVQLFLMDSAFEGASIVYNTNNWLLLFRTCGYNIVQYPLILLETNFIRLCSETGHLLGPLQCGRFRVCYRFDWFCGSHPAYRTDCFRRDSIRFFVFAAMASRALWTWTRQTP
jgi:glycosyltransferase involved in cell wall biosynthesis